MKRLTALQFEANLYRLVGEVARGESIVITDNETGEPIAEVHPINEKSDASPELRHGDSKH